MRVLGVVMIAWCLGTTGADAGNIDRGRYVFDTAGCLACHTDSKNGGQPLAGGRALSTPFGVYYSPNITSDRQYGIGSWTEADFVTALRHGKNPAGGAYFPVFPYTSFTAMSDRDMADLRAYIMSLPGVNKPNRDHETGIVFGNRLLATIWQMLFFEPGPMVADMTKSDQWNRGAYLVEALGHCGECHTPRGRLGNLENGRRMAGSKLGPEGGMIPNITPDRKTGIGKWRDDDLKDLFSIGLLPDGDFAGGGMAEVITNTTSKWTKDDLDAVIVYLRSLPRVINRTTTKKTGSTGASEW